MAHADAIIGNPPFLGTNPLQDAHAELDAAVLDAYGFSAKKDLLAQLLAFKLEVAAKIDAGHPVLSPGTPPSYPKPNSVRHGICAGTDSIY